MRFKAAITTIVLSVGLTIAAAVVRAAPAGKSSSPQRGPLIADARDAKFLEGLRQRRLFELAEKHCQDLLADSKLDEHRRAELTIELSRTLAQHALESPPADQAALWRRARAVVDEFAKAHPQSPQLLVVRAQGALAALLQGEEGREAAQIDGRRETLNEARQVLRVACDQLRKLQADVAATIKRQPRGAAPAQGQLSTAQLLSLEMHLRHELSRALLNQGLCYPAAGADRVNSLTQALELLKSLAQQELEPALGWAVSLDTVAALRALDDYPAAQRALAAVEKTQPPPEIAPRLRVERIRLALARGQVDEALSEAGRGGPRPHADWAPAEYAQLEAYTTAWRNALQRKDAAEAARWERTSMDQVRAIEQAHGPLWSRKAESLLASSIAVSDTAPSAALLMRLAGSYYRGGRIDEALAAYDRASATARQAGDVGAAFDAALAAATIERERHALRPALDRYRKLAIEWPRNAKASEAHLLAVHAAAQVAATQQPPQLDEYKQLLDEHVANWPAAATAGQAWCWLGRLAEHEHRPRDALSAFRHVNPNHPQHAEAIEAAGRSYVQLVAESRGHEAEQERLASEAVSYFESLIAADPAPAKDTPAARAATLAAARVALAGLRGARPRPNRYSTRRWRGTLMRRRNGKPRPGACWSPRWPRGVESNKPKESSNRFRCVPRPKHLRSVNCLATCAVEPAARRAGSWPNSRSPCWTICCWRPIASMPRRCQPSNVNGRRHWRPPAGGEKRSKRFDRWLWRIPATDRRKKIWPLCSRVAATTASRPRSNSGASWPARVAPVRLAGYGLDTAWRARNSIWGTLKRPALRSSWSRPRIRIWEVR